MGIERPPFKPDNMVVASGYYLCNDFPDNWEGLEDKVLMDYIKDNIWEPFEYTDPEEIFDLIVTLRNELDAAFNFGIQYQIAIEQLN